MNLFQADGRTMNDFSMRAPCVRCGSRAGRIERRGEQNCVLCDDCGRWAYNAPRTETGEKQRSVTTSRSGIKPKQRARIMVRALGRCELCSNVAPLHCGHLLSVDDAAAIGLSESDINSDANLAAMCEECNLGLGKMSVPPVLYVALVKRRLQEVAVS